MSNVIIKATTTTDRKNETNYSLYLLNKKIPYTIFVAKKNEGHRSLLIHQEKSCFKAQTQKKKLIVGVRPRISRPKTSKNVSALPHDLSHFSVLGSDEVGNGSYFGPLTVCAAYVDKTKLRFIVNLVFAIQKS